MTPSRLVRTAGWAQRHRWLALALWVLVLGGITVAAQAVGSAFRDDHSLPGTESQRVADAFAARGQQPDTIQVVLQRDGGVRAADLDTVLSEVERLPKVADVRPPATAGDVAFATVTLDGTDVPAEDVRRIVDTAQRDGDLRVELGGDPVRAAEEAPGGAAEGAGLLAALVVLVLMFGSFLAACLPLVTAVFAVGSTLGVITLASHLTALPGYAPPLMMLVGLGVGTDYALLVFARFRGELHRGADRGQATRTALDTAGRSVLFAGTTVMIALLGLLALGLGSLRGVALAVALTVLLTMVASLTLLPALLTIFGARVERAVHKRPHRGSGTRWRRWSDTVQRRPLPALVLSLAALGALSVPALGMQLGFADAGTEDETATSRQAYDLLAGGFGPGVNGPLVVMADGGGTEELATALDGVDGVARVGEPQELGGDLGVVLVFPDSAPQDAATSDLVTRLRADVLPAVEAGTGATYLVGGATAAADDFAAAVAARLPLFLLVVVGLSTLLLVVVFRSLLIPLKAAVLNLLSIGAALGVVTLVFAPTGPVEAFVPVLVFAIVFGLSMDYEVFLVSRMHEEWRRTGDAARAVREGLATTGGVITAAAAIMVVVFGAFVLSPDRMLRQFGLGLAVAVLVDALVIRCLVVPAVMRLLGPRAWWLPRRLGALLPPIALEPPELHPKRAEITRSNELR